MHVFLLSVWLNAAANSCLGITEAFLKWSVWGIFEDLCPSGRKSESIERCTNTLVWVHAWRIFNSERFSCGVRIRISLNLTTVQLSLVSVRWGFFGGLFFCTTWHNVDVWRTASVSASLQKCSVFPANSRVVSAAVRAPRARLPQTALLKVRYLIGALRETGFFLGYDVREALVLLLLADCKDRAETMSRFID